jgi:hypothetical protein
MSDIDYGGPAVQCAVDVDMMTGGLRIVTRMRGGDAGKMYMKINEAGMAVWERIDPAEHVTKWDDPFLLKLPEEVCRALLEALSGWFGGTSTVRAARVDLEREAGRVDLMLGALMAIATSTALPAGDAPDELRARQRAEASRAAREYGGGQ